MSEIIIGPGGLKTRIRLDIGSASYTSVIIFDRERQNQGVVASGTYGS